MKPPRIALDLDLTIGHEKIKDKPAWQRHLYARLQERVGKGDTRIRIKYVDRDAAAKNPTREQIQKWYEQIYSELAKAYGELLKEHEKLKNEEGHLHRSINDRNDQIAALQEENLDLLAANQAILALITRAHTAEVRVEDYVQMYGQS